MSKLQWVPTPSFLYRNYLYMRVASSLPTSSRFLDVGSGNGDFVKKLLALGYTGESLDYSPKAVSFMKKHLGNAKGVAIRLGDIFKFRPKNKFDIVFCFEVMEHVNKDAEAMKKIFDFIKPDGVFVLSVPAHMSLWANIDKIKGHFRRYERDELKDKLEKVGFKVQTIWCYGFPFLRLIRAISSSGKFIKSNIPNQKAKKTSESSIQQEYNPIFAPLISSPFVTIPLFAIMNLFLDTDWGLGYVVVAQKPTSLKSKKR